MAKNDDLNVTLQSVLRCQEGVKKASDIENWISSAPSPEMVRSVRFELGQSLSEFGLTLKRALDPRAKSGFTRQYISRLEHGQDAINAELAGAIWDIAARLDQVPAGTGGAVVARVMAQPGQIPEDSFIPRGAKVVQCARPGCRIRFLKTHPRQKYHDKECGK